MQVTLDPQIEQLITERIRAGDYTTTDQYVADAVREKLEFDSLPTPDPLLTAEDIAEFDAADEAYRRGETIDFDTFKADLVKKYLKP